MSTALPGLANVERDWVRYTPEQRVLRFGFYFVCVAAVVWSLKTIDIIPEFLYDAPAQLKDFFTRMWPMDAAYYPQSGNLFIADGDNHCIRKISPDGLVTTYAGTGLAGYADGPAATAQFRTPFDVCVDGEGNVYVSDFENQYIRRIDTDGTVSTVAGNGLAGYVDGPSATAQFNYPRGIVIDATGNLYVSDSWNHRVRKIDASGEVSTYAGGGNIFGVQSVSEFKDGSDTSARV